MNGKNTKKNKTIIAVIISVVLLSLVGFLYLENCKESAREQAQILALRFAEAYFSGDMDGVKMHLSESCSQGAECYEPGEGVPAGLEIVRAKGFDSIKIHNMRTSTHVSVEYLAEYDDDSLSYLEMDIVWEDSGWKIKSYGLEK